MALSVEEVEKLRAAGFSDEEIVAYDKESSAAPAAPAPVDPAAPPMGANGLPSYDLNAEPPEVAQPREGTFTENLMMAPEFVEQGLKIAGTGVGLYGLARAPGLIGRGFDAWKESSRAKIASADSAKMAEEGRQARFNAKVENDMLKADEMRMKNDELRAKNEATRQSRTAPAERPVIFRQQPGVTPGPGGQVPVQGPPTANNYMPRMNNLAEQYRGAQTVVQQQARPAPAPAQPSSGMTYRPIQGGGGGMRGGGGGGGGGSLMQDPLNRRFRPMQY